MEEKPIEIVTIPPGTRIHINGIPFELKDSAEAYGLASNLHLALYKLHVPQSLIDGTKEVGKQSWGTEE